MATSQMHTFLDTLADRLRDREALTNVAVLTSIMGDDTPNESIVFISGDSDQEWAPFGNRTRDEEFSLLGAVWIQSPGAGEEAAKEARDRAFLLLGEVEDQLREDPKVGGTALLGAAFTGVRLDQGIAPNGRWVLLEFDIRAKTRLPRPVSS